MAERVGIGVTQVTEVRPLVNVLKALAGFLVGRDPLFERGIVQVTPLPQQEVKLALLGVGGVQPVFVGTDQRDRITHASVPMQPESQWVFAHRD